MANSLNFGDSTNMNEGVRSGRILNLDRDYIPVKGAVKLTRRSLETGEIIDSHEDHNLIVLVGRQAVLRILGGDRASVKITKIALGTGGAPDATPFVPTPPADADTALVAEVWRGDIDSHSYPTQTSLQFVRLVTSDQVNAIVDEAVLIFDDNATIFARFTFPSQYLKNDFGSSLEIDWTIQM